MPLLQVIPLYNGAAIFGPAPTIITTVDPARDQRTTYPGINGTDRILLGTGGVQIDVMGIQVGNTLVDLANIEAVWRALQIASTTATLYDTAGVSWLNCFLEAYMPEEGIMPWIGDTGVSRRYRAVFRALSLP